MATSMGQRPVVRARSSALSAGQGPVVSLSPTSLNFGPQSVQAPNVPQAITLTHTGQLALAVTSIAVTGQNGRMTIQILYNDPVAGFVSILAVDDNAFSLRWRAGSPHGPRVPYLGSVPHGGGRS